MAKRKPPKTMLGAYSRFILLGLGILGAAFTIHIAGDIYQWTKKQFTSEEVIS